MALKLFINLPVTDLARSIRFYEAIGAHREPKFSNDQAGMMVLSKAISVMLLSHEFYAGFTTKPIADAHQASQIILCLSADSRDDVDALVVQAGAGGGRTDPGPKQEMGATMYGRSFEDPDGHHWEVMWMNEAAAAVGASALQQAEEA